MRRYFCLTIIIVLVLTLSLLGAACTQTGTTTTGGTTGTTKPTTTAATTTATTSAKPSLVTAPGEFPVVTQPYTLRIFAAVPANVENLLTNDFTIMYEKKGGVKVEWEIVPTSDAQNMKLLSLSTGDYPDVYAVSMSREDQMKYAGSVLVPLKALIDEHSIWFKEVFEDVKYVKEMVTSLRARSRGYLSNCCVEGPGSLCPLDGLVLQF